MTAALGPVVRLMRARTTGKGCDVDTCLFDVALHQLGYIATWYLNEGDASMRQPRSAHYSVVVESPGAGCPPSGFPFGSPFIDLRNVEAHLNPRVPLRSHPRGDNHFFWSCGAREHSYHPGVIPAPISSLARFKIQKPRPKVTP